MKMLRPRDAAGTMLAAAILLLLIWFALRAALPLSLTLSPWPAGFFPAPLTWQLDSAAWEIGLYVLLLVPLSLLATGRFSATAADDAPALDRPAATRLAEIIRLASPLLLALATLPAVAAISLPALVASWALLGLVWALAAWRWRTGRALFLLGLAWAGPALLWAALSGLPGFAPALLGNVGNWPLMARLWLVLAALWQVGVLPFYRRPSGERPLRLLAPAAAGAILLVRLAAAENLALLLTLAGLLALLLAAYRAWSHLTRPAVVAGAMLLALAGFLFLAAGWADGPAVLWQARVLLLAGGVLLLLPAVLRHKWLPDSRAEWLTARAGAFLALAALAAVPLTAGFAGRAALYAAWVANDRWLLLLVTALLQTLVAGAALLLVWPGAGEGMVRGATPATGQWPALLPRIALLVLGLPLLSVGGLATTPGVVWLALLLPAGAALLLAHFAGEAQEIQATVREALRPPRPLPRPAPSLRRFLTQAGSAVRHAADILEGEAGLLWLLFLLLLFVLLR